MKNIKTRDEFINEGLFSKKSKYEDALNRIRQYIIGIPIDSIEREKIGAVDIYKIVIKKHKSKAEDPYDEEVWDEDVEIQVVWDSNGNYSILVNEDDIGVSNREARKLYKLIDNRKINKVEIEKQARIDKALKKIM
jgi:hypothetical protein